MKKIYILLLVCICSIANATDYYWVSGNGNWSDVSKWRTGSSGGPVATTVPTSSDNVFFNASSFTGNAQTVTVDIAGVCNNMDWTGSTTTYSGATNGPRFLIHTQFSIFGDLKFQSGMRPIAFNYGAGIRFSATSTGKTITTQGVLIGTTSCRNFINFVGLGGGWTLVDSIASNSEIVLQAGNFNSNDKPIRCGAFVANGSTARTLTLGTSIIKVTGGCDITNQFLVDMTNLTLSVASSTILFTPLYGNTKVCLGASWDNSPNHVVLGRVINYFPSFFIAPYPQDGYMSDNNKSLTINDLYIYSNVTFQQRCTINDSLYLAPGKKATFRNNYWYQINYDFGASGKFITNATCGKPNIIVGEMGNTTPINLIRSGGWGTTTFNYCNIEGINLTGGGTASAANSINGGNNSGINFTAPAAKNLYWVGGTGNWHDGAHWSLTSGGAGSSCIPNPLDNVFFDANSFSGGGQSVRIDSANAYCNNISWTGATNSPTFISGTGISTSVSLKIYGSLTFISAMTVNLTIPVYFQSSGVATITSATKTFNNNVYIAGTGTFNLADSMRVLGGATCGYCNTGALYINSGTFNTNNKAVRVKKLMSTTSTTRAINLGSSKIYVNNNESDSPSNTWEIVSTNCTFNAGTSTIYIENANSQPNVTNFYGGSNRYNNVIFRNSANSIPAIRDFRADTLQMYCRANFFNNDTIDGQLLLTGGLIYQFEAAKTILFNGSAVLYSDGGCAGIVEIKSSSGTQAIFRKTTGSIGTVNNVSLQNMQGTGGATFNATASSDFGGNTGWTIGAAVSRTLYWVGGNGNWTDQSHWAISSGGAGGNCPPSRIDDIYFNDASFSANGQTVTMDLVEASCRKMDWSGLSTRTAIWSGTTTQRINIFGDFILDANLTQNYSGIISFKGTGNIRTAGKLLRNHINIDCGAGSYTILEDFNANAAWAYVSYQSLNMLSGTFNMNGFNVYLCGFTASDATGACTLNMSSSNVYIHNGWYVKWWNDTQPLLTLNPGTSTIYLGTDGFMGGSKSYSKVVTHPDGCAYIGGHNTIKVLRCRGNAPIQGNNTITDSLVFKSGKTYTISAGTTQTFACNAYVDMYGDPGLVITLQTNSAGVSATFTKPCGNICANYVWVKDIACTGGAVWRAGTFFDNQGGNTGWNYDPYGTAGDGAMTGGAGPICQGAASTLNFTFSGYAPVTLSKKLVITKSDGSANDTIVCRGDTTITYNPNASTTYTFAKLSSNDCFIGSSAITGTPTAAFTVKNGTAGVWDGSTSTDWLNCINWANGALPTSTTDVSITNGLARYPVISGAGAVCRNLGIASGGSSPSLTINNSASTLEVYGNIALDGTLSHSNGTVTLTGNATNALGGTADYSFYNLEIDNSNNSSMSRSVTVNNTLTLTSGSLLINSSTLSLLGTVAGSGTLSGTINSILNISGTGALGTLNFAAAARQLGNLNLNRTSSGTVTLGTPLSVRSNVNFLNGILITNSSNYLNFDDNATCSNASNSSHVSGPVYKTGNDAFTFPIGKGGNYTWCAITAPSVATDVFSAEFFTADPVATFGSARQADLTSIGLCKYWQVNRVAGTSSVSVRLSWNAGNCGTAIGTPADLRVAHWTGAIWVNEGNGGTNTTAANEGNIVTTAAIASFSPFTIASKTNNNALPIELLSFTAKKNKKSVVLDWSTATETNNEFFTIERSQNGMNFEALLTKKGAGTTTQRMDYNDVDNYPNKGLNYYRLKQTDTDGQFTYSNTVPVDFTSAGIDFVVFPNPIKRDYENGITLNIAGLVSDTSVLVVLHDVLGKQYYSKVIVTDGEGKIRLAVESSETLAKGVYMITASSNDELISKKIIIE